MCGRVTLTIPDVETLAALVEASVLPSDAPKYRPRYNVAPSDEHFIVLPSRREEQALPAPGEARRAEQATARVLLPAVWGLPGGVINARSETAERRFREAFRGRRAVVPADGFFEWTGPREARRPLWFRARTPGLLWMAGLVEELPDGRLGFAILTTAASGEVARVHDRMPVLLPRERVTLWLAKPDSSLLVPAPADFLTATEVSRRANDVKNDDPSVLGPPEPEAEKPPPRQLGLF
jgi:putative SOS response-associated peptidase YedK